MDEYIFVIFGGTGDLTKRKLAPAFAHLVAQGVIAPSSTLIGVARGEYTDSSYHKLLTDATSDKLAKIDTRFFRADATKFENISKLGEYVKDLNKPNARIVFYLATSFQLFDPILRSIKEQGLSNNAIILFEKPFGSDLASAKTLEDEIARVFSKESIFHIDHYLGKQTVQKIQTLKFKNTIFEGMLNKDFVESIEMIVNEDMGVADRLGYYDESGAIKDMIQNHLLQVLSMVLMDKPQGSSSHVEKCKVLQSIQFNPNKNNLLGQYSSYKKELEDKNLPYSNTETFARLHFSSNYQRWQGVDLILQTGKRLEKKEGRIIITFKSVSDMPQNRIVLDIYPKQDITICFNTLNHEKQVQQASFDFCHECLFGPNTVDEYAFLLEEALKGNHEFFPSSEEILESWRIIQDIDKSKIPFVIYEDAVSPKIN